MNTRHVSVSPQCGEGAPEIEIDVGDKVDNPHVANQIYMLEKNIEFIKNQHSQMLVTLHDEIERLKKINNGKRLKLSIAKICKGNSF